MSDYEIKKAQEAFKAHEEDVAVRKRYTDFPLEFSRIDKELAQLRKVINELKSLLVVGGKDEA